MQRVPAASASLEAGPAPSEVPLPAGGDLGSAFHRDLEAARHALANLAHRLRRVRRTTTRSDAERGVTSAELVARLALGLAKEHDYVLIPLLSRLDDFAKTLTSDRDVATGAIEEGLALVDRYLHELHDTHLRLLELAGADPSIGPPAVMTLTQLASDYERARVRWATVRVMLRGYEGGAGGYRALLGLTLAYECRAEKAWHDLEEEYVRTSLPPKFPAAVADHWREELDKARASGRADRVRVEEFVRRTGALLDRPRPPAG
ncbi:MAG: hypothetical protein WBG19_09435 [Thermoplasmata archaeon]